MCKNMLLSLSFLRGAVIGCFLASILPGSLQAEASYKTNGGEYSLTGALPSDQVQPRMALRPNGGYLVWQDRVTDGDGYGIRALRLDSGYSKVLAPFRVNQVGALDQEKPFVAALKNGGAIFVWQGGKLGFQRIYARFLSSTNTWITDDIQVSSSTAEFQINASAAVLADGNIAVVWAGYDQNGSGAMQDVFCQILSPTGTKVGGEFNVNTFRAYNQRTPAVSALSTGGFVVAWISEQQRVNADNPSPNDLLAGTTTPSVDVYARTFLAGGAPASPETLVNTNSLTCANPAVAASHDGGFIVIWTERELSVRTNSWDVFSRRFSTPAAPGLVQRVNTVTYGDQLAPQISRAGEDFLAVWTSLGHDGSLEGVYGRFLSPAGLAVQDEFRVNTVTLSKQIHPAVASDGEGQFLVGWASFLGGTRGYDLFAQRYIGAGQALTAMAAPFVHAPFVLMNGVYQPRLQVSWTAQSGLPVDHYELFVDDSTTAVSVSSNNWTMTANHGLQPSSTHTFRIGYVLADGRRSPLSAGATSATWSGLSWGGIPFEWMSEEFGMEVSAWPPATRLLAPDGPSVLHVFQSGGSPNNPASWLRTKLEPTSQGLFLSWNPQPGLIYQVQKSTDLAQWQNVSGPRLATGGYDSLQVSQGTSCYYRVLLMR